MCLFDKGFELLEWNENINSLYMQYLKMSSYNTIQSLNYMYILKLKVMVI